MTTKPLAIENAETWARWADMSELLVNLVGAPDALPTMYAGPKSRKVLVKLGDGQVISQAVFRSIVAHEIDRRMPVKP